MRWPKTLPTSRKMSNKLDIFELLGKIDKKDWGFLDGLSEEQRKGFAPIVVLRWLSGSGNQTHLLNVNTLVNSTVFNLYKHPDLLYKLMVAATPPGKKNYNWVKTKKKEKATKRIDVVKRYLNVPTRQAEEYVRLYSNEDILEMSEALGDLPDFVKQLKSELK